MCLPQAEYQGGKPGVRGDRGPQSNSRSRIEFPWDRWEFDELHTNHGDRREGSSWLSDSAFLHYHRIEQLLPKFGWIRPAQRLVDRSLGRPLLRTTLEAHQTRGGGIAEFAILVGIDEVVA